MGKLTGILEGDRALVCLISNINAALYGKRPEDMLGPNEIKHLVHWVNGYKKGNTTQGKMFRYIEETVYGGRKNTGVYALKKTLIDKKWIEMDVDVIHFKYQILLNPLHNFEYELKWEDQQSIE